MAGELQLGRIEYQPHSERPSGGGDIPPPLTDWHAAYERLRRWVVMADENLPDSPAFAKRVLRIALANKP